MTEKNTIYFWVKGNSSIQKHSCVTRQQTFIRINDPKKRNQVLPRLRDRSGLVQLGCLDPRSSLKKHKIGVGYTATVCMCWSPAPTHFYRFPTPAGLSRLLWCGYPPFHSWAILGSLLSPVGAAPGHTCLWSPDPRLADAAAQGADWSAACGAYWDSVHGAALLGCHRSFFCRIVQVVLQSGLSRFTKSLAWDSCLTPL